MNREEVEQFEDTYNQLKRIDDARSLTYDAMNDASRYELTDSRLSHLSPAQIGETMGKFDANFLGTPAYR